MAAEKGDIAAAKDHLAKYMKTDPAAAQAMRAYAEALGKPEAARLAPDFY